jgi:hypothetical protein
LTVFHEKEIIMQFLKHVCIGTMVLMLMYSFAAMVSNNAALQNDKSSRAESNMVLEGQPMTSDQMASAIGGQGCFGVGSTNCCTESKFLGSAAAIGMYFLPNPWFGGAVLLSSIHQAAFC